MPVSSTDSQPLIQQVVWNDLCIACGACIAACPRTNIRPVFHPQRGAEEVAIIDPAACVSCPRPCDTVCPSLTIDFRAQLATRPDDASASAPPLRDGGIRSTHLGWSPHFRDDAASSSGGVIRAFIAHALRAGTPVICLAWDVDANAYRPRMLIGPDQMQEVPGSIYHSTSFVGAIDLIRQATSPVLLVAIPCQLSGILNFVANQEPALGKKIGLVCGIVCGWMYSHHAPRAFAESKGLAQPNLPATTYRGGDRVGKIRLSSDGTVHAFTRREFATYREALDYRSAFSTDFNRLRCRLCEDHLNMGADVIAGDAWLERSGSRKVSVIACRTARGQEALAVLERTRQIQLEPASFADLIESQSVNLVFGTRARRMNSILRQQGHVVPRFFYADAAVPVATRPRDAISVWMELTRRRLVRSGHYRVYRWLYAFRNPRLALRFLRKALRG